MEVILPLARLWREGGRNDRTPHAAVTGVLWIILFLHLFFPRYRCQGMTWLRSSTGFSVSVKGYRGLSKISHFRSVPQMWEYAARNNWYFFYPFPRRLK